MLPRRAPNRVPPFLHFFIHSFIPQASPTTLCVLVLSPVWVVTTGSGALVHVLEPRAGQGPGEATARSEGVGHTFKWLRWGLP